MPVPLVYELMPSATVNVLRAVCLTLAAVVFIGSGVLHLARPGVYEQIVPPGFGPPALIVFVSGIAEIAGGVGLLVPRLRRSAGFGLIALLVAVFPANLFMAMHADRFPQFSPWTLWARLPLQPLMVAWIWWCAIRRNMDRQAMMNDD